MRSTTRLEPVSCATSRWLNPAGPVCSPALKSAARRSRDGTGTMGKASTVGEHVQPCRTMSVRRAGAAPLALQSYRRSRDLHSHDHAHRSHEPSG
jgi:hypothetical protein